MILRVIRFFISVLMLSVITILPPRVAGDTLILKSGTLLVGKVKSSSEESIIFKNYYGAFNVKRGDIDKLYVTKSYKEDIALRKKMGMDFSEQDIKRNYEAGEKKLTEQEEEKLKPDKRSEAPLRSGGSLSAEGGWLSSYGEVRDTLPYGFCGFIAYEQGLDFIAGGRYPFMPGLRAEGGYLYYNSGDASMQGFTGSMGPVWLFPVTGGNVRFSIQPGVSTLDIENGELSASTFTFTLHSILGYEYTFSDASIFINARFLYLYDKDVFFNSAGLSAGFSFKLW